MKPIIEMIQSGDGAWAYVDEKQVDLVYQLHAIAGRDLTQCDIWLNDDSIWVDHEPLRQSLAELRRNLTHVFDQHFHSNEMLEIHCENYWKAFQIARMHLSGTVLELKDLKRKTQSQQAARKPRKKDPLRGKILSVMGAHKHGVDGFKTFMAMWELGHLDGVSVEGIEGTSRYIVTDENDDAGSKTYSWGTLEKMFAI